MTLEALPPLRETLDAHGLLARKSLGQHFLLDLNITRKIARLAGPLDGQRVIEVGPGPGGLTRALLEAGARVTAVEKDARFLPLLEELSQACDGRLEVILADALTVDEAALAGDEPASVVSNLPYNVGTALLIKWLTATFTPASMTLMFQKEVADRIVAPTNGEAYGRLAVIAQATARAERVMDVPARAFTPPPKVESAVVRLVPRADRPAAQVRDALQRVTAAAFGQRRKMLRASLKPLGGEALCAAADIDPQARAETISVAGFLTLAECWLARR
jgi:16S rRNA (adenine1518-N6/adenine1519-N6)-dimethyltransferase